MSQYRKFIVAVVGAGLAFVNSFFGLDVKLNAGQLLDLAIPILTALGVWAVPNKVK